MEWPDDVLHLVKEHYFARLRGAVARARRVRRHAVALNARWPYNHVDLYETEAGGVVCMCGATHVRSKPGERVAFLVACDPRCPLCVAPRGVEVPIGPSHKHFPRREGESTWMWGFLPSTGAFLSVTSVQRWVHV